jgi:outer membrane protein OmpA-like peptidoglycan-associated protein
MNMKKVIYLCLLMFAMPVAAFDRQVYFGVGAGVSTLSPDVAGPNFTLDEKNSAAFSATLGMRFTHRINGELAFTQLGKAGLSDGEDISYSAASVGLLAYVLGAETPQPGRSGLRGYLRLGANKINYDYDISITEANNTAIWAGAGLEWPLGNRFKLRGEFASFDGDAQAVTVGLLYKLGAGTVSKPKVEQPQPSETPKAPEPVAQPQVEQPQVEQPQVEQPEIEPTPTPQPQTQPIPEVEVIELAQPEPAPQLRVEPPASGVLRGVDFEVDSATLTPMARQILTRYAESMLAYPTTTIEIAAHADGTAGSAEKLALTRSRAIAVARHLVANGVVVSRMKARAFGANKPRAAGDSIGARRLNNRVEIIVR